VARPGEGKGEGDEIRVIYFAPGSGDKVKLLYCTATGRHGTIATPRCGRDAPPPS
jgi:hypothetical protein